MRRSTSARRTSRRSGNCASDSQRRPCWTRPAFRQSRNGRSRPMRLTEFCEATSPQTYETSWHHRMIAHYLELVMRCEIKNLMVNTPPQHSKTTIVGERFPVYV